MSPVTKKKETGKTVSVDFTNVSASGAIPEDNYAVKVEDYTQEEGPKAPYIQWVLKVSQGEFKGKKLWHITTLAPDGLWNLRQTLEAMGIEVPQGKMNINFKEKEYKGLEFGVTTENEIYNKKERSKVVDVFALTEEPGEEGSSEEGTTEEPSSEEGGEESGGGDTFTAEEARAHWEGLKPVERTKQANDAGLEGKWGKKSWDDLSDEDKAAMYTISDAEPETAEESSEEKPDLEKMSLKQLLAYADENEVELTDNQKTSSKKALRAIQVALDL